MKRTYLVLVVPFFISTWVYAQKDSIGGSILSASLQFPPKEVNWLSSKGFTYDTYNGKNEEVNYYLRQAVRYRKQRKNNLLIGTGIGFAAATPLFIYAGIRIHDLVTHPRMHFLNFGGTVIKTLLIMAGVVVTGTGYGIEHSFTPTV